MAGRIRKVSDPKMLAARMDQARVEGKSVDFDYEDTTSVIDIALERGQRATDAAIAKVREKIQSLEKKPSLA